MKFEKFKSILLIFLVISSIVLTMNKWSNEKLWPGGYNFFSDIKNYFKADPSENSVSAFDPVEVVLKPAKVILNNSGSHVLYTKSSSEYNSLFNEIKSALDLVYASTSYQESTLDEWKDILKRKSCYFEYPVEYDSGYFMYQLSGKVNFPGISTVREFILASDTRISKVSYVYIKDASSDKILKYRIDFENTVIDDMLEHVPTLSSGNDYFSFELNFDRKDEDSIEHHHIIDPDVLINITPMQIPQIWEHNLFSDIANRPDLYNFILQTFGYNTSTIRRYTEHDNSLVFVENYGTLKLHTNGYLEYKSLNNTQGVSLPAGTLNECINSCISFVNSITSSLGFQKGMYFELSSDIKNINSKSFTLNFDYYINDRMIIPASNAHSITIEVKSGKIVSYKQLCKSFYNTEEKETYPSAIEAIDMLEAQEESNKISELFTAYTFDRNLKIWKPMWLIENEKGEIAVVSKESEVAE